MADSAFYEGIAEEMIGKFGRLASFTKHGPSIGTYHEEVVKETLRSLFSSRIQLRTGFTFHPTGKASSQGDILLVDESDPAPYLFRQGDFVVAHPRSVAAVIEVKTQLRKRDFLHAVKNLASFQAVADEEGMQERRYCPGFIFSYDGPRFTPYNLDQWYRSIDLPHEMKYYPLQIFSLRCGLLKLVPGEMFGHRPIIENTDAKLKAKSLSIFLATIRKQVELRVGLTKTNPFSYADLDGLLVAHSVLQFGKGLSDVGPPAGLVNRGEFYSRPLRGRP